MLFPGFCLADTWEFGVQQTTGNATLTLHVQSVGGNAWDLDYNTGQMIVLTSYDKTFNNNSSYTFDSPDNHNSGHNGTMPWGLIQFNLSTTSPPASISFTINFRDENWATRYPYGPDITLFFNPTNGTAYLSPPSGKTSFGNLNISSGDTVRIWDAYHYQDDQWTANFLSPLLLQNTVSNLSSGYLSVNSAQYSSGNAAAVAYNNNYYIGTKADGTNIDRFPNFLGLGLTYKHNNWNGTASDYFLTRQKTVDQNNNVHNAQFNILYSATLRNSLDGTVYTGANGGYIPFVDPWYVANSGGSQLGTADTITSGSSPTGAYNQSSGGVFLNQDYNIAGNPHYSLQAPVSQTINSHTGFFGGWTASPSGYITFQNATSPTTALVFNSAGATVTANYIYSVVASNATLQAGTYTFAGSLTINSGATLTLTSGTTLNFPSGASLVVNGALSANGVTFTSTSGSWTGITLNHDGSSLTNCKISSASSPLIITNVNTATISGCIINNSVFAGTQAISVINSTPNIVSVQINGQSGSSNGVRYTTGRGGTLQESTIRTCGSGNGIVIQGNASPTISGCIIDTNYFYGIIVTSDGSGTPLITGNTFYGNGTHGSTRQYFNIYFTASGGTVQSNFMTGSSAGVCSYNASSVTAGSGQNGSNIITGNDYGLLCMGTGSWMYFGYHVTNGPYNGTCNTISGSTYDDAFASGGATILAEYNWWGQSPPNWNKIYQGTGSTLDSTNWLTSQGGCPYGGGGDVIVQGGSQLTTGVDSSGSASELYQRATNAFFNKDYAASASLYRVILRRNVSVAEKQQAMVRLLSVYLQSGDTTILSDLKSYMVGSDSLSQTAKEQLANAYAASGNTSKAVSLANDLIAKNHGTEIEKRALLLLASLRGYDKSAESISAQALKDVKARFGSSLDQGLIAALTTASDVPAVSFSSNREAVQKVKGEAKVDNASTAVTEYGIENYPNPFNPTTTIAYQLPKDGRVTIKIFDAIGREVTTLVDEFKPSGRYSVQFDASHLSSGIYFYSLRSGSFNVVKKMSLIK